MARDKAAAPAQAHAAAHAPKGAPAAAHDGAAAPAAGAAGGLAPEQCLWCLKGDYTLHYGPRMLLTCDMCLVRHAFSARARFVPPPARAVRLPRAARAP